MSNIPRKSAATGAHHATLQVPLAIAAAALALALVVAMPETPRAPAIDRGEVQKAIATLKSPLIRQTGRFLKQPVRLDPAIADRS